MFGGPHGDQEPVSFISWFAHVIGKVIVEVSERFQQVDKLDVSSKDARIRETTSMGK